MYWPRHLFLPKESEMLHNCLSLLELKLFFFNGCSVCNSVSILNFSTRSLLSLVSTWASPGDFVLQHVILKEDSQLGSALSPTMEMDFKWIFMSIEPILSIK